MKIESKQICIDASGLNFYKKRSSFSAYAEGKIEK